MIRNLTRDDRRTYIELATEFYGTDAVLAPVPVSHFEAAFDEMMRSSVYAEGFLFELDGRAVGYALLAKTYSQEAGGPVVWIEELYVRPQYRSKGLGSEFFKFLEKNRPAARYRLETERGNSRASRLYSRLGYSEFAYDQMIKVPPSENGGRD